MPPPDLPSPHAEPERYQGRPLLVVLENYVLDCIGKLPPGSSDRLTQMMQQVGRASCRERVSECV